MSSTNRDLTTGEVAYRFRCSQLTIVRLCDRGLLKNYRVPGSRFRRIRLEDAKEFAEKNGMPWEDEREGEAK